MPTADDRRLATRADLNDLVRAVRAEVHASAHRLRVTVGWLLLAHGVALVAALVLVLA